MALFHIDMKYNAIRNLLPPLCLLSLLTLSGCTSLSAWVANLPSYFDDIQHHSDIAYHPEHGLTLDIYQPNTTKHASPNGHPVMIFFYGGGWRSGDKDIYRFVGSRFANQGYLVVIPNYRKYPDVTFPAFVQDSALAIAKTQQIAKDYGADPTQLFLMGHSAGGHMAALLAADERYLTNVGVNSNDIKGVIGLAGPYHFTPQAEHLVAIFGPANNYPNMQVSTFIDGQEPPFLLLQGAQDTTVSSANVTRFSQALEQNQVQYQIKTYPGLGHVGLISSLTWILDSRAPIDEDILTFLTNPAGLRQLSKAETP